MKKYILLFNLFLAIVLIILACSSDLDSSKSDKEISILNKSQYVLKHIIIHKSDQPYEEAASLISKPLEINGCVVFYTDSEEKHRVTVTRVKHEGGSLLAYTTAYAINFSKDMLLEYYDTEFRLGNSSLPPSYTCRNYEPINWCQRILPNTSCSNTGNIGIFNASNKAIIIYVGDSDIHSPKASIIAAIKASSFGCKVDITSFSEFRVMVYATLYENACYGSTTTPIAQYQFKTDSKSSFPICNNDIDSSRPDSGRLVVYNNTDRIIEVKRGRTDDQTYIGELFATIDRNSESEVRLPLGNIYLIFQSTNNITGVAEKVLLADQFYVETDEAESIVITQEHIEPPINTAKVEITNNMDIIVSVFKGNTNVPLENINCSCGDIGKGRIGLFNIDEQTSFYIKAKTTDGTSTLGESSSFDIVAGAEVKLTLDSNGFSEESE